MKQIKATPAPKLHNEKLYYFSYLFAAVIVVAMLGQLFRFDKVIEAVASEQMLGGQGGVVFWSILVVVELFALPFLLRLKISPLLRVCSLVMVFIVPLLWAVLAGFQLAGNPTVLGVFGTEVSAFSSAAVTIVVVLIGLLGATTALASLGTWKQAKKALSKK